MDLDSINDTILCIGSNGAKLGYHVHPLIALQHNVLEDQVSQCNVNNIFLIHVTAKLS